MLFEIYCIYQMANLKNIVDEYASNHNYQFNFENSTILMKAVEISNYIPNINPIIKKYIELNPKEVNRRIDHVTPLMITCMLSGKSSTDRTVKILIDAGANLDMVGFDNQTAIMFAVNYYDSSTEHTIQMLIDAGSDLNIKMANGFTLLICAIENKNILKIIVESGRVDLNQKNYNGLTALMLARDDCAQILVDAGANLNICDEYNMNALMLLSKNNIRKNYKTDHNTARILIEASIDLNTINHEGSTALMIMCKSSSSELIIQTVQLLINAGADLNILDHQNMNALMIASAYQSESSIEIIKILIKSKNGQTALIFLCTNTKITDEYYLMMRTIVDAGCNLNILDNDNKTAFDYFILSNNFLNSIFDMFVEHSAKYNINNRQLHKIIKDRAEIINLRLENSLLKSELKIIREKILLHPDSEFVKDIEKHFNSLKMH